MNTYKMSALNPIRFHQVGVGDFAYNNIPSFEFLKGYNQVYFHGDTPWIQVLSSVNTAEMYVQLVDINGDLIRDYGNMWKHGTKMGDWWLYYWPYYFPFTVDDGVYFLKITIVHTVGTVLLYSEPIYICSDKENTVKIEYSNDVNDFDAIFTAPEGVTFMMRLEGGMKSDGFAPGGKYTIFQDLDYQAVMLESQPYNVEKWTFGPGNGIPNHIADKLNRIFSLNNVTIDGVQYVRNEGAKMERIGETNYPLAGWAIDLIKSENPYSDSFTKSNTQPFTADNDIVTADTTYYSADQTLY